ncbi:MAG TPA: tetratricopeptide repeat protein [Rhizomicrobium sp.]|nr:tetratricopeptide repeat protein [Rhizomicrobium sp.]
MTISGDINALLEQAIALHKAGKPAEAERLYHLIVGREPRLALAQHNLGVVIVQRGAVAESVAHFKAARDADPRNGLYWLSYARALLRSGQAPEALTTLEQAKSRGLSGAGLEALMAEALGAQRRDDPEALLRLGNAETANGNVEKAIEAYRRAVAARPDFAEAHFCLGSLLSEHGRIAEGFAHFMRRAELVYGKGLAVPKDEPLHKRKHDLEQRDYLAGGKAAEDAPPLAAVFHVEKGERLSGPAVNPANATPELFAQWKAAEPQFVVLENFLVPEALERLRRYCAGSTIWRRVYDAGYIGATPEDGFACPLLAQIAEEIRATYAPIFAPHHFHYLGAFKYDSTLSTGTNIHADNSAVNVNFYIAPDEANLDPDSGGMDIWNVTMPEGIDMRVYNGDENAARAFLKASKAQVTSIPHRANRAVIFRSDLFHKTSDCRFKEGYLNKRINVSLLFGHRGAPTR